MTGVVHKGVHMKWFDLVAERDEMLGWGLGFDVYGHRHFNGDAWHGHVMVRLGPFFLELRFGFDGEKE